MKKKLTRMLLLLVLMFFTANNIYSYNALRKILKPKSEEETSNRGNSNGSDKGYDKKTISNSAGSIVFDS